MEFLSREEAFEPVEDEVKIEIDKSKYKFRFTRNFFSRRNLSTWSTFFPKKFNNKNPINMIQIGVFEGADLVWCLQNILGHYRSRIVAIDTWMESGSKMDQKCMVKAYDTVKLNLNPWRKQIEIIRGRSQDELKKLIKDGILVHDVPILKRQWDLIVIDGDHSAKSVYIDAIQSFKLIRKGGWMVFDDYHNRITKKHHVQEGVKKFVDDYEDFLKLEWCNRHCVCLSRK